MELSVIQGVCFLQGVCVEQPGLQPDIPDVFSMELSNYTESVQQLLCYSKKLGAAAEVVNLLWLIYGIH